MFQEIQNFGTGELTVDLVFPSTQTLLYHQMLCFPFLISVYNKIMYNYYIDGVASFNSKVIFVL